MRLGLLLQLF